jgi:hypothetical protein
LPRSLHALTLPRQAGHFILVGAIPVAGPRDRCRIEIEMVRMISTVITEEAFEAIKATMPLGSVGFEKEVNAKGERTIWLAPNVLDKLKAMRGPVETYSDVILRLAAGERLHAHGPTCR